jgi:hypothetical protein
MTSDKPKDTYAQVIARINLWTELCCRVKYMCEADNVQEMSKRDRKQERNK